MRVKTSVVSNLIGSCLLCASVVVAQGPGGPGGRGGEGGGRGPGGQQSLLLKALDTNGDGKLSADEIAAAPKNLLKADVNGDGSITLDELQGPPEAAVAGPDDLSKQLMAFDKTGKGYLVASDLPARMQALFARADTNHDGKVTPDELRALAAKQTYPTGTQKMSTNDPIFLALDLNHDGVIDPSEIAKANVSLLALDKNHDGEISAAELQPPPPTAADQADHMLGENDLDKDGRISKAEAPDYLKANFDAMDTNHDGYLDRNELIAWFTANPGRGGGRGGPGGGRGGQGRGPGSGQGGQDGPPNGENGR